VVAHVPILYVISKKTTGNGECNVNEFIVIGEITDGGE
jgi:hypothetical protein